MNQIRMFFVHKDKLTGPDMMVGTIGSVSSRTFILMLTLIIVLLSIYVSRRRHLVKTVFISLWSFCIVYEVAVTAFDSLTGTSIGQDWSESLPPDSCSLYLYAMPFAIWGKGSTRWMGSSYVCTLGSVGVLVNFIYPVQLLSYSFLSFRGLHTLLYHGNLIFTFLVMIESGTSASGE